MLQFLVVFALLASAAAQSCSLAGKTLTYNLTSGSISSSTQYSFTATQVTQTTYSVNSAGACTSTYGPLSYNVTFNADNTSWTAYLSDFLSNHVSSSCNYTTTPGPTSTGTPSPTSTYPACPFAYGIGNFTTDCSNTTVAFNYPFNYGGGCNATLGLTQYSVSVSPTTVPATTTPAPTTTPPPSTTAGSNPSPPPPGPTFTPTPSPSAAALRAVSALVGVAAVALLLVA